MSTAGRQAMILHQVYNIRPGNLLRDPQGNLGTVEQGPGGSVVFRDSGGTVITGLPRHELARAGRLRRLVQTASSSPETAAASTTSASPRARPTRSAAGTSQLDPRGSGFIRVSGSPIDTWTSMVGMLGGPQRAVGGGPRSARRTGPDLTGPARRAGCRPSPPPVRPSAPRLSTPRLPALRPSARPGPLVALAPSWLWPPRGSGAPHAFGEARYLVRPWYASSGQWLGAPGGR